MRRLTMFSRYSEKSMPVAACRIARMRAEPLFVVGRRSVLLRAQGIRDIRVPANSYQFGGNAFRRQDEIHAAGGHGGLRHGGELGGGRVLRKRHAPAALMASTPAEPSEPVPERITPMARLPHWSASDRRKRSMGMCDPGVCVRGASLSAPPCNGQIDVCRYDVDVVGFQRHAVGRFADRHGGGSRQNLGEQALVIVDRDVG